MGWLRLSAGRIAPSVRVVSAWDGPAPKLRMDEQRRVRQERLRWHCRRALLELDIVFQRFWARNEVLTNQDEAALEKLLEMEDHDLWYLVSGRTETDDPQLKRMIERLCHP